MPGPGCEEIFFALAAERREHAPMIIDSAEGNE